MPNTSPLLPENSEFEWLAPGELSSEPTRLALSYWRSLRGDRPWPSREDLRPRDMAGLLPYMSLVKVIDGGKDFEHRIVGDIIVRAFSIPVQNRRFSEIAEDAPLLVEKSFLSFRKVLAMRRPVSWRQRTGYKDAHLVFTEAEMTLLPLGRTTETVDHILGVGAYEACLGRRW